MACCPSVRREDALCQRLPAGDMHPHADLRVGVPADTAIAEQLKGLE
jgi:hypothetical protein